MTFVIDQGLAMYWGTSRWNAVEIMVGPATAEPEPETAAGSGSGLLAGVSELKVL